MIFSTFDYNHLPQKEEKEELEEHLCGENFSNYLSEMIVII